MADNLLDKASILLTPTAYDNGRMLSVKPSKDLYGSEQITNGDFSNGSTGWTISGSASVGVNKLNVNAGAFDFFATQSALVNGEKYKITLDAEVTSGDILLYTGAQFGTISSSGSYTFYTTSDSAQIRFRSSGSALIGSIDNVSVVEDLSGDFTFSRGSAATRVNAQGLVENVQIISSELVSNGNFSQIGSELVTNGDFATDSNWIKNSNWSIANGKATSIGSGRLFQSIPFLETNIGTTVKVSFDIIDVTANGVVVNCYGGVSQLFTTVGTHTFTTTTTNNTNLYFNNSGDGNLIGSISNVSVKEVGQDWNLGTGWSIGDGVINFSNPTGTELYQALSTTIGKYKIKFDLNITSGTCQTSFTSPSTSTVESFTTSGTKEVIIETTSNYSRFRFVGLGGSDLTITNISVKEVTDDTDLPRINYDNGIGSWLLEPQSTNLITYSSDWSVANFNNSSVLLNTDISPDGTQNSDTITFNGAYSAIRKNLTYTAGVTYTISFYAKKLSGTGIFDMYDNTNANTIASFNLSDEWVRYSGTFTPSVNSSLVYWLRQGAGTSLQTFLIWGGQIEQQSFATSYIPTDGAANTRLQDIATNSGNASLINSTEGVLYAEIASLSNQVSSNYISLSDGTYNNRVSLMYSSGTNVIRAFLRLGGASQADLSITASDITEFNKVAFKFSENDFALWINGIEVGTDTSGSTIPIGTLTKLAFSEINTSGGLFIGKCRALAVYKEALTDEQLTALTTI